MQTIARLYALSKRNIILRYKNSLAGFLWGFLKPLLYLMIFIVIFSAQFPSVNNYVLYATSGLIFWFFFSNVTSQSVSNIVSSAGLIKSVNLPTILYPLSEMLSELFNFLLTLVVFLVVMNWFGIQYGFHLLLIVPYLILYGAFCLGITLALSSVNVFLRDAGILWNTIQPALFYMTPIAYPESMIPEHFSFIIRFNPVYTFIKLGRSIFSDGPAFSSALWLHCFYLSAISFLLGLLVFNKLKNQFISAI